MGGGAKMKTLCCLKSSDPIFTEFHLFFQSLLLELESQPLTDSDAQAHIHPANQGAGTLTLALYVFPFPSIAMYVFVRVYVTLASLCSRLEDYHAFATINSKNWSDPASPTSCTCVHNCIMLDSKQMAILNLCTSLCEFDFVPPTFIMQTS
jgi:hypothetical protein